MTDDWKLCLTGSSVGKSSTSAKDRQSSARTYSRPGSARSNHDLSINGGGDSARSSISNVSLPQSVGGRHRVPGHGSKISAFAASHSSINSPSSTSAANSARNRRANSGSVKLSVRQQSSMTDLRVIDNDVVVGKSPFAESVRNNSPASRNNSPLAAGSNLQFSSLSVTDLRDDQVELDSCRESRTQPPLQTKSNEAARRNAAAITIQRWYRRCRQNRQTLKTTNSLSMKQLLESKRQDILRQRNVGGRDDDRQKMKEEKARLARQEAIQELQRKREEKRQHDRAVAEEEISFLQASGKISDRPGSGRKTGAAKSQRKVVTPGHKSVITNAGAKTLQNGSPVKSSKQQVNVTDHEPASMTTDDGQSADTDADVMSHAAENTSSTVTTKTTFDELMQALSKLEEEDPLPVSQRQKSKEILNWLDDLEKDRDELETGSHRSEPVSDGIASSVAKNEMFSYLDKVEVESRLGDIDQDIERINSMLIKPALLVPSSDEMLEKASLAASEVTQQMLSQKLELEEKKRSVAMLQKALNQQRELTIRHAKETEKEMKKRLDVQKTEYEEAIKRHISFIDQLIDDKKSLSEKCEQLVLELKSVDKKYQDKIRTLEENHKLELKKLHDLQGATEKLRREKWIEEKTKKIKELTVKGLQPQLQQLIADHKDELKKIKSIHEAEMLASDERAGQRYIRQIEELRDQLASEKEAACARERQLARESYEEQLRQREMLYQQQQQRLYQEVREEKERIAESGRRQRAELDTLQRKLEDTHSNMMASVRTEYEAAKREQEQRHAAQIKQLQEQLAIEKEVWQENYRKKQEAVLLQKERELQQQVKYSRDQDIERVMQQLLKENQTAIDECEREAEKRLKKVRDKLEKEKEDAERSERQITEKYTQIKARLAEVEGENGCLKVALRQKDKDVEEYRKLLDKRNEERDHIADIIRQEFVDKIVATEEENKRLKTDTAELKARHRVELERVKADIDVVVKAKEDEMDEVHKRVKQAIAKKEETLTQLREQYEKAVKRADHLEDLLEQQRKQLLGRK